MSAAGLSDPEIEALAVRTFAGLASAVLAVSGGADSRLLVLLAERWRASASTGSCQIHVATVDHRLRPASAQEAAWVAERSSHAGLTHHTLVWDATRPRAGLQQAARSARFSLLEGLVARLALPQPVAIVLGHHLDDQAETFVMRLARGSGIDGLAAMAPARQHGPAGTLLLRPLLDVPKTRIIATLAERGIDWLEDPSNANPDFERVRVRQALPALAAAGVEAAAIARSARRLGRARVALEQMTAELAGRALDCHGGLFAEIALAGFEAAPEELRLRLLQRVLASFGGQDAPPRLSNIEVLAEKLAGPAPAVATLGGCRIARQTGRLVAVREPGRTGLPVIELAPGETKLWDNRFVVGASADRPSPVSVRALPPQAWTALKAARREAGLPPPAVPRAAALTLPSFWEGERLIGIAHPALDTSPPLGELGLSARFAHG